MAGNVTETIRIKVSPTECDNPIWVGWKNRLGGTDQWVFDGQRSEVLKINNRSEFARTIEDLETSEGSVEVHNVESWDEIDLVAAHVDEQEKDALMTIADSPFVFMLTNNDTWDQAGNKPEFERIIPLSRSLSYFREGNGNLYTFTIRVKRQPKENVWQ